MSLREDLLLFVVDTDTYAGNFEREMCAFMTGRIGECGVGKKSRRQYRDAGHKPLRDLVESHSDEHGCFRPVTIWATPGWLNDGMGHEYREGHYDPSVVIENYNRKLLEYAESTKKAYAAAHGEREAQRILSECLITDGVIHKCPAYLSVGIYLSRRPTEEEIAFLKQRAQAFCGVLADYPIWLRGEYYWLSLGYRASR